ncbi:CapA family protein [Fusobacterium mortiferum]|uniref:CapA family protein n=1 Tax=Fusobacterium mortiferum TaxID=850 RepID=UPI0035641CD6
MEKNISLIIGGDLVPTESNRKLFENNQIEKLIGKELKEELEKVDFRIFNLEAPITESNDKLLKCGPNLKIDPKSINGIKGLNPSLLTLANNHIMDFKEQGLKETIEVLTNNNINYVGIGENLSSLKKSHILENNGVKIGIYVCAEREFSIATDEICGVNPLELVENLEDIKELKSICNYVIVLHHGGKEYYRYPSPMLKKICNKMVEYGADLVVCQHSHCVGSYEEYKNGKIIYGQGNFIFDMADNEYWNTSILVKLTLSKNGTKKLEYIPILKDKNKIKLAGLKEKEEILAGLKKRSIEIKDKRFIEKQYRKFSKEYIINYLYSISGVPRLLRGIDKKILKNRLLNYLYKNKLTMVLNFIECEAHRELLIEGLKNKIKR